MDVDLADFVQKPLAVHLSVLLLFIYLWICFSSYLSGKHSIPSMEVSPLPCARIRRLLPYWQHGGCGLRQLGHDPSTPMTNTIPFTGHRNGGET